MSSYRHRARRVALGVAVTAVLAAAAAASAATAYDGIAGIELPSSDISITGNFAGLALGQLSGSWSATINHEPLVYQVGTSTTVDGGTFTLTSGGVTFTGAIDSGGTVTPTSLPSGCGNQTFTVSVTLSAAGDHPLAGSFNGTLTHYQTTILRKCVTYSASIVGAGVFAK